MEIPPRRALSSPAEGGESWVKGPRTEELGGRCAPCGASSRNSTRHGSPLARSSAREAPSFAPFCPLGSGDDRTARANESSPSLRSRRGGRRSARSCTPRRERSSSPPTPAAATTISRTCGNDRSSGRRQARHVDTSQAHIAGHEQVEQGGAPPGLVHLDQPARSFPADLRDVINLIGNTNNRGRDRGGPFAHRDDRGSQPPR